MHLLTNLLVWFVMCLSSSRGAEYRLGMMSPFKHPRLGWTNNAAAATIAIEKAKSEGLMVGHNITEIQNIMFKNTKRYNKDAFIPAGIYHYGTPYHTRVIWRDDKCSGLGGAGNAVLLRDVDDIDVFIGPPCSASTKPAGLLASFWNFPIMSQASSDPELANKNVYKTLVRLGPPFNKLGYAMVELLQHFHWKRVVIITRRKVDNKRVFCDYSSRSYTEPFRANNITIADWMMFDDGIADSAIDELLVRVKQRGRIVILCSENLGDKRRILLRAYRKGMMNGDYLYITPDHLPPSDVEIPWVRGDDDDAIAKEAFKSVFQITVSDMGSQEVDNFRDQVAIKMADPPWNYNTTLVSGIRGSEYSPFLHDIVYLYLLILNETIAEGGNHRNGTLIFDKAKGKVFRGITGNVKVDSNGDREPDYWIWKLAGSGFEVVIEARMTSSHTQKIHVLRTITWTTDDGLPPKDTPPCGFFGEFCPILQRGNTVYVIAGILFSAVFLIGIPFALYIYRRTHYERQLERQLWKVHFDDIKITKSRVIGSISQLSLNTLCSGHSSVHVSDTHSALGTDQQVFAKIGIFRQSIVTIKPLTATKLIHLGRVDHVELKTMWDLRQENVNTFVGLCLDERWPCLLTSYCSKGSLQDIVENVDIKLDWMFKVSLITDLINGMYYIHNSSLKQHGNLKSSNCVVDNRWVLKVTDFGVRRIRSSYSKEAPNEYQEYMRMFWTAPELLQSLESPHTSSQKGDVYAFGIILFETLCRTQPYDTSSYIPKDIIHRVKRTEDPPFRPHVINQSYINKGDTSDAPLAMMEIMMSCYTEEPEDRPSFQNLRSKLLKLNMGRKANVVDNMVTMLEKYANNLESIVEQRTLELVDEKKKTDMLLYRMLPKVVAERLKSGERIAPEIFESVTIFFSDIVGFTSLSSISTPIEVVDFLNDLYISFDNIIAQFDVYKVETIGDAYMVVSGLPVRNGNEHTTQIVNMALALLESVNTFKIKHRPALKLQLRIGIHTGPCAAGVVGHTMPRYCLFGDTVNMASRMESNGEDFSSLLTNHSSPNINLAALRIHVSEATYNSLCSREEYEIMERGEMHIKGKGVQKTYWIKSCSWTALVVR